jgi:hypothetical protein
MTFEALHNGPSTTTFFSPADIVATGHVPNALSFGMLEKTTKGAHIIKCNSTSMQHSPANGCDLYTTS